MVAVKNKQTQGRSRRPQLRRRRLRFLTRVLLLRPSSGFNDADFRKTGSFKPASQSPPIKNHHPRKSPQPKTLNRTPSNILNQLKTRSGILGAVIRRKSMLAASLTIRNKTPKQYPKVAQNQKRDFRSSNLPEENVESKFKNLPKLPLVKSSSSGVWHSDLAELEEKLIGNDKKIEFTNAEEWKGSVEKKKELGERLLAQYAQEYMSSRGQHGDIKRRRGLVLPRIRFPRCLF